MSHLARQLFRPNRINQKKFSTSIGKLHVNRKLLVSSAFLGAGAGIYFFQDQPTRRKIKVTLQGIGRYIRSITTGAIVTLDYKISLHDVTEESEGYQKLLKKVHKRSANRLLRCCLENGGLYIKLGQGLITMNHLLPREYLETLVVLQDKVLSRGPHEVETLFLEEFGKLPNEVFKSWDEEPIAAASLAQVHKAVTQDDEEVAVKVQYIDLRDRFHGDMMTMQILAKALGWLYPSLNFAWMLQELKGNLAKELDFVAEGENAEKCAKDLSHLGFVYVPKVYWDLTSTKILTTEFIHGIKISNKKELRNQGLSLTDIGYKLVKCFADQIFISGHVHADPHPGNLFIRKDSSGAAQLVLLDHGLYEYIGTGERVALANLYKAIVLKDEEAMQRHALEMNVTEWHIFSCFLTQKYVATKSKPAPDWRKIKSKDDWKRLPDEEKKAFRDQLKDAHEKMIEVMKDMPSALLLISRNLNTIRSINRDHGNLVDRYTVMARSAVEGAQVGNVREGGIGSILRTYKEKAVFEYHLRLDTIRSWVIVKVLLLLQWLGRIPDLEEMINQKTPRDVDFAS